MSGGVKHYKGWLVAQWDRVAGWSCVAVGAVLVVAGAASVSSAGRVLDQLSYLASSVAIGLFLLGLGAVLILTADLRDEWRKLDEISTALRQGQAGSIPGPIGSGPAEVTLPAETSEPKYQTVTLRAVTWPVFGLAGLGLVGGASGVRQSLDQASALRWTQLSALSLALALVAVTATYLRGRQGLARRFAGLVPAGAAVSTAATAPAAATDIVHVVSGSAHYHSADCQLLRFSASTPLPRGEIGQLTACQVCS